jgi:hypothetical protein
VDLRDVDETTVNRGCRAYRSGDSCRDHPQISRTRQNMKRSTVRNIVIWPMHTLPSSGSSKKSTMASAFTRPWATARRLSSNARY